jgi:hypothetical protein
MPAAQGRVACCAGHPRALLAHPACATPKRGPYAWSGSALPPDGRPAPARQVMDFLGAAAFSKAVQALDVKAGLLVCLKIIKNNKDYFDQSLDEIKLLRHVNAADPHDAHGMLRLYDYFYYKARSPCVSAQAGAPALCLRRPARPPCV